MSWVNPDPSDFYIRNLKDLRIGGLCKTLFAGQMPLVMPSWSSAGTSVKSRKLKHRSRENNEMKLENSEPHDKCRLEVLLKTTIQAVCDVTVVFVSTAAWQDSRIQYVSLWLHKTADVWWIMAVLNIHQLLSYYKVVMRLNWTWIQRL